MELRILILTFEIILVIMELQEILEVDPRAVVVIQDKAIDGGLKVSVMRIARNHWEKRAAGFKSS